MIVRFYPRRLWAHCADACDVMLPTLTLAGVDEGERW